MRIRVNGLPAPQGSKRHVGGGRMVESSRAVGPWREAVRAEAQRMSETQLDMDPDGFREFGRAPLSVTVVFVLPRPDGHFGTGRNAGVVRPSAPRFPVAKQKNDIDKLARSTLDALVDGGIMADDAQVCSLSVAKVFAAKDEAVGAIIDVEAMT